MLFGHRTFWFPAPTQRLTTLDNSIFRRSDTFFWPESSRYMYGAYKCIEANIIYIKKCFLTLTYIHTWQRCLSGQGLEVWVAIMSLRIRSLKTCGYQLLPLLSFPPIHKESHSSRLKKVGGNKEDQLDGRNSPRGHGHTMPKV